MMPHKTVAHMEQDDLYTWKGDRAAGHAEASVTLAVLITLFRNLAQFAICSFFGPFPFAKVW